MEDWLLEDCADLGIDPDSIGVSQEIEVQQSNFVDDGDCILLDGDPFSC